MTAPVKYATVLAMISLPMIGGCEAPGAGEMEVALPVLRLMRVGQRCHQTLNGARLSELQRTQGVMFGRPAAVRLLSGTGMETWYRVGVRVDQTGIGVLSTGYLSITTTSFGRMPERAI
mgnify:CR=1 FL=1